MTPRITKEGNSVTVAEPSEYERLCEALRDGAELIAGADNQSEPGLTKRMVIEFLGFLLLPEQPTAARAIREGVERAKEKELPSQVFDNYALSGRTVAVYLGPKVENPPPDCGWRAYEISDWRFADITNVPPPEDLSALKKRIGWDREKGERLRKWANTESAILFIKDMDAADIIRQHIAPDCPFSPEALRPTIQAPLDHEDDPDQSEETV